jgi:uncharacterized membrane protein HdeD (DUF308 family)
MNMKTQFSKSWWFLLIKGLLFIFFGILVTFYPQETLQKLFFLLGLVILLGGVITLGLSLMNKKDNKSWKGLLAFAIVDLALGLFIMLFTKLALDILIVVIGIWALLIGAYQLIQYFGLSKEARQKSLMPYIGIASIILGLIMVFMPSTTSGFMVVLIGIMSIIVGIFLVGGSIKLRGAKG